MKNKNMCTLKELNLQAAMLKGKGDLEGVIRLAEANGLTVRTAERYLMGEEPTLTTQKELAIGRLLLESVDLDLRQSVVLTGILIVGNKDSQGNWALSGVAWKSLQTGQIITEEMWEKIYGALWKLMDYEDSGLSPDEVQAMVELRDKKPECIQMPQKMVDHIMQRFTECK